MARVGAVAAQVQPGRVRPDHRQGLDLLHIQRQQAVVLEQHQAFGGGPVGQLAVGGAVGHPFGFGRVGIRISNRPSRNLAASTRADRPVHVCFGNVPARTSANNVLE